MGLMQCLVFILLLFFQNIFNFHFEIYKLFYIAIKKYIKSSPLKTLNFKRNYEHPLGHPISQFPAQYLFTGYNSCALYYEWLTVFFKEKL